jgi:hypothetical protein
MPRTELADASDALQSAADTCDDEAARDRLTDLATQLDRLSTADHGPDHGRLARIQSALHDLRSDADDATADAIADANTSINAYRQDLEGV